MNFQFADGIIVCGMDSGDWSGKVCGVLPEEHRGKRFSMEAEWKKSVHKIEEFNLGRGNFVHGIVNYNTGAAELTPGTLMQRERS